MEEKKVSLLDTSDYPIGSPIKPSEWYKLWCGEPSALDGIDFAKLYPSSPITSADLNTSQFK